MRIVNMRWMRNCVSVMSIALLIVIGLFVANTNAVDPPTWIGAPAQPTGEFTLTLGEVRFDPAVAIPLPPPGWDESLEDAAGNNIRLIQFDGPILQHSLNAVEAMGINIIQYIHPYTYIIWSDTASRIAASKLPNVRWTGEFIPAYRVLPPYRQTIANESDVRIMLYRGADSDAAVQQIEALGGVLTDRGALDATFEIARFTLTDAQLRSAAKVPGVYSIKHFPTDGGARGEITNQINADNVDGSNLAFPGYMSWLNTLGIDGSGVIIANVDLGVQENHPDLINRMLPCAGVSCSTTSNNHGTHTAGIMAADGSSGTLDGNGFLRGLGVAPGANLVEQVYGPFLGTPAGMLQLMTDSYNNGASLSGNSWGPAGTPRGYDDDTRAIDVGVRDADPVAAGNQSLTYVLSFMNGNGGTSTQGTPDEAKNLFNIGSTKAQQFSGQQILDIDDLSSNTAHGPALDGRTIPHMVAPGYYVDSSENSNYGLRCGTSMASPHVSGATALFIEYYRSLAGFTVDPSPALIKAAFLPVCHDLSGNRDADGGTLGRPFDNKQGWGRMNLDAVVNPNAAGVLYYDNPQIFSSTGEQWSVDLEPLDPAQPMRMMLVWTDAPGHGLGGSTPAWNNNLDLIAETGSTFRGNNFAGSGFSVAGGTADDRNNTEGIFLGPLPPAQVTIIISASNINSDGIPNNADTTDQDFAFVCYNCIEGGIACPADIAGANGAVDVFDLLELLANWGTSGPGAAIASPTNVVDVFDLLELLNAWGNCV